MFEFTPDDMDCLSEVYSLREMHYEIVKENLKLKHFYEITGDETILVEGFSDIVGNMAKFFKEMISKIKEFFKKVMMFVDSYFLELDRFVTRYKKELDSVKTVSFTIQGYKYTLHDAPDMTPFNNIVSEYNSGLAESPKMKADDIKKQQVEYLSPANMDKIRATVLGSSKPIQEEEFAEEVRKFYRNGELDKVDIEVDTDMFRRIISGAKDLTFGKKEAIKTRDDLIALLSKAENFFDKKVSVVYRGDSQKIALKRVKVEDNKFKEDDTDYAPDSGLKSVEQFVRFKYNQTHAVASIINLVACERANAFKDNVKFHMAIIRKALADSKTKTENDKSDDK